MADCIDEFVDRWIFLAEERKRYCMNCDKRKGIKKGKMRFLYDIGDAPCRSCGIGDVLDDFDDFPAADVVPVVRCADCKWFQCNMRWDGYLPDGVSEYECRHLCGPCDPTDYCSHGTKMDKEAQE